MARQAPDLFVPNGNGRSKLAVGSFVANGSFGDVYSLGGAHKGSVVKVYRKPEFATSSEAKIRWMTDTRPPLMPAQHAGKAYQQLAWPTFPVFDKAGDFAGFTMPEIDLSGAVGLEWIMEKSGRTASRIRENYQFRLHIARNIAALFDSLHGVGVCVIDVKPDNIQVYRDRGFICLLDCDSLIPLDRRQSVSNVACTPNYILPEAREADGEYVFDNLREEQDRFALAILIFRLMNEGVSPFLGRIIDPALAGKGLELQERIEAGLYPYGLTGNRRVQPFVPSRHEWFAVETRRLFDRAFASRRRPTAKEWADHFAVMLDPASGKLQACSVNPEEHVHFGLGCGLCQAELQIGAVLKSRTKRPPSVPAPPPPSPRAPPPRPQSVAPRPAPTTASAPNWIVPVGVVGAIALFVAVLGDSISTSLQSLENGQETVTITAVAQPWTAEVVSGEGINLRVGPGEAYGKERAALGAGDRFTVTDTAQAVDGREWYYVQMPDGTRGFVAGWVAERLTRNVANLEMASEAATPSYSDSNVEPVQDREPAFAAERISQTQAEPRLDASPAPSPARRRAMQEPTARLAPDGGSQVLCIMPDGSEVRLRIEECRFNNGTVYQ